MNAELIERLMAGTLPVRPHQRIPERVEAIRRLAAAGLTDRQIALRVRTTQNNVAQIRCRHRIPRSRLVA